MEISTSISRIMDSSPVVGQPRLRENVAGNRRNECCEGSKKTQEKGGKAFLVPRHERRWTREGEFAPSFSLDRSREEPVGDCRVAINAVELTPGCPFAGKVRLKERTSGRQPPRRAYERGRRVAKRGGEARACL